MMLSKTKSALFPLLTVVAAMTSSAFASPARVFGGDDAEPGDYPYFVSMGGCGGTLIAPDMVLSAAHCGSREGAKITIGAYTKNSLAGGAQERICEKWVPDPKYGTGGISINYDFALCKLDEPVTIDSNIKLKLNKNDAVPSDGKKLIAMGLGKDVGSDNIPFINPNPILQQITVPVVSQEECETYHAGIVVTDIMLCAGFGENKRGVCKGDSGGPLIKRKQKSDGSIVDSLVGVVSFTSGGDFIGKPAVYARVSKNVNWIEEESCDMGSIADFCDNDPPLPCDQDLIITLTTDNYPYETSSTLKDSDNNEVMNWDYPIGPYTYRHSLCLKSNECYEFVIEDSFGDGLCTGGECESYSINLNGEEILSEIGDFATSRTETFCTGPPSPSLPPSFLDCQDDKSFEFEDDPDKTCEWVGKGKDEKRIRKRCKKEWLGEKVYDKWCPQTCGEKVGLGPCA